VSRLATWGPAIAWTTAVLLFSSATFNADNTGGLVAPLLAWLLPWIAPSTIDLVHGLVRKTAHLSEYALLAALWFRALARSGVAGAPAATWLALLIGVAVAVTDELHQSTLPERTGSAWDVAIDATGALLAVVAVRLGWARATEGATGLLLWVAAVGGLAALALGLASGAGGGVFWLTVPAASAALLYRRHSGRRARSR
jgi:VanZ family protein